MSRLYSGWLGLVAICLVYPTARGAELDALLPDDTEIAVHVNVRQILDSALVKKHGLKPAEKALQANPDVQKVLKALDFDPLKDVTNITIAGPGGTDDKGLVIVRGKFDAKKIAEKIADLDRPDLKTTTVDGRKIFEVTPPDKRAGKERLYVSVVGSEALVATGNKDYLLTMLKRHDKKQGPTLNKQVRELIEKTDGKQSVWAIASGDGLRKNPVGDDEKAKEVLDRIEAVRVGLTLSDALRFDSIVTAKNADGAKALKADLESGLDSAKGVVTLLAGNRAEFAIVGDFLDSLKSSVNDKDLIVEGKLSGENLEKVLPKK
jgi:hypothetical protein